MLKLKLNVVLLNRVPDVFVHGLLVVPQFALRGRRVLALVARQSPEDGLGVAVLLVPLELRHEDGRVVAEVAPEGKSIKIGLPGKLIL